MLHPKSYNKLRIIYNYHFHQKPLDCDIAWSWVKLGHGKYFHDLTLMRGSIGQVYLNYMKLKVYMMSQVANKYLILTTFVLGVGTAGISHANENYLSEGTQEVGVQGSVDFDYADKYQVLLNTNYGYFIDNGWEIGGDMDINATKSYKSAAVGIFTEYNFVNSSNLTPYMGVGTQLLAANYNDVENHSSTDSFDATAMNLKLSAGVKYFINKNVALTAEVNHNIATDDLHMSGGDPKRSLTKFLIGTKFYF